MGDLVLPFMYIFFLLKEGLLYIFTESISFADYKKGFGGKFGIQTDRQDASAVGWDTLEKVPQHASQKGPFVCQM